MDSRGFRKAFDDDCHKTTFARKQELQNIYIWRFGLLETIKQRHLDYTVIYECNRIYLGYDEKKELIKIRIRFVTILKQELYTIWKEVPN